MKLKVLGTGSSGNSYLLENERECLVLDAGIPFMAAKKAVAFNVSKIVGVAVTHSHGDHAKYAMEYLDAGFSVFRPYMERSPFGCRFGGFEVFPFALVHDVPCYGFAIKHKDFGRMVYVTDTEYCPVSFADWKPNILLVEANYAMETLEAADRERTVRNHIISGHMDIETTKEFVEENKSPQLRHVILCHLSERHGDERQFRDTCSKLVSCTVEVARPGLCVDISEVPFL